jgi:hypothetical protein
LWKGISLSDPSMRSPVGIKWFFGFFFSDKLFLLLGCPVAVLRPHSWLSDLFARCDLDVLVSVGIAAVSRPLFHPENGR